MFHNYLKIAWRNIVRNKSVSFINIIGLSVGITSVLLLSIFIFNEWSFDHFHKNAENIFRVNTTFFTNNIKEGESPEFVAAFAPEAKANFPEIISYCRISTPKTFIINHQSDNYSIQNIIYADDSFFDLFSFNVIYGNKDRALKEPYSIVISKQTAEKIFGDANAVGKVLYINGEAQPYTISAISQDVPYNSSIQFNALISFATLYSIHKPTANKDWNMLGWNGGQQFITYLQLYSKKYLSSITQKMPQFMWDKVNSQYEQANSKVEISLQELNKIHLYYDADSKNTRTNLYAFGIIAFLILLISCFNYINLSTALSFSRYKEIGVRKVFGASSAQVAKQFIGESVLTVFISFSLALIATFILSYFITEYLTPSLLISSDNLFLIFLLTLFLLLIIGIGAGSFLAFYVSRLRVTQVFKNKYQGGKPGMLKNILITFQFTISIALIAMALIINYQINFLKNKSLGLDKDQVMILSLSSPSAQKFQSVLKEKIKNISTVSDVSASSEIPYNGITSNGFLPDDRKEYIMPHHLITDENFFDVYKMNVNMGSEALKEFYNNENVCFINTSMAKTLGWKNPIGRKLKRDTTYTIIGVIQDFNYSSLHDKIEPLVITKKAHGMEYENISIRYTSVHPQQLINNIKNIWNNTVTDTPFDFWFLDDGYNKLYKKEKMFSILFISFSLISILLSLSGIVGLLSISLKRKTKEIGIRKVLGANILNLLHQFSYSYISILIIAALISIPFTWLYANQWLQGFAYRIKVNVWYFIGAFIVVFLIAICIIIFQTLKAAKANPVNSLKAE